MRAIAVACLTFLLASLGRPAAARDAITSVVESEGIVAQRGFNSVSQLLTPFSDSTLRALFRGYTSNSAATATINVRGITAVGSYAANSSALRVVAPAAGLDRSFDGGTRPESVRLLRDYLNSRDATDAVSRLLRAGVRSLPIDPVAGGPNSLMTQFAVADTGRALQDGLGERGGLGLGIGARIGTFSAAGYNSTNVSIPFDASWRVTERDILRLDIPLAYTSSGGATSYSGNVGGIYQRQVTENWQLQGSARLGAAGSLDLGSGSGVWGLGAVSTLRLRLDDTWRLTVVNAVNHVATFSAEIGVRSADYNIANTIFRNGLVLSRPIPYTVMGYRLHASAYVVSTHFAGSPVFIRHFQEMGVFVTPGADSRFGVGLQVMTGDRGLFGVSMSTGVRF